MLMFSRNGNATGDVHGNNGAHASPQHHRLSTSSVAMMSPRGVFLSNNSSSNSPGSYASRGNGRNSYYDTSYTKSQNTSKALPIATTIAKGQQNGTNCPPPTEHKTSMFKRSSSRSTMKKNRPHSWHSTLQKGFNRARSRSKGREEREHRKEEKEQQAQTYSSNAKGKKVAIKGIQILVPILSSKLASSKLFVLTN